MVGPVRCIVVSVDSSGESEEVLETEGTVSVDTGTEGCQIF